MSTIGAKAQWMPTARASRAATAWPRSIVSGSQEAAIAIGTGKMGSSGDIAGHRGRSNVQRIGLAPRQSPTNPRGGDAGEGRR